jgi:hypothetical protein
MADAGGGDSRRRHEGPMSSFGGGSQTVKPVCLLHGATVGDTQKHRFSGVAQLLKKAIEAFSPDS